MKSALFLIFTCLLALAAHGALPKDSLSIEERNKARQDINILLGLPEDSYFIKPLTQADRINDANLVTLYKKATAAYESGVKFFDNGEYEKALNLFQQAVTIYPIHRNAFGYILKSLHAIAKSSDPLAVAEETDKKRSASYNEKFMAGLNEFNRQNYAAALKIWNAVTEAAPDYTKAFEYIRKAQERLEAIAGNYLNQGQYFLQKGETALAIAEWEKGLAAIPGHPALKAQIDNARNREKLAVESFLSEAETRIKEKRYEEAARILSEALKKHPDNKALKERLNEVGRVTDKFFSEKLGQAKSLYDSKKFDEAASRLKEILAVDADHAEARALYQKIIEQRDIAEKQAALSEIFTDAVAALEKELFFEAQDRLKVIYEQSPDWPGLKEKLKAATEGLSRLEMRKKTAIAFNRGLEAFESGLYQNAAKEWREVLKDDPQNAMAKDYLAEAEKRALESTGKTAARDGEIMKLTRSAQAMAAKKEFQGAVEAYGRALDADPNNEVVRKALKNARRSLLQEQDKKTPVNDKKAEELMLQGINLYRDGQYKKAVECWQQVISAVPGHKKAQAYIQNVSVKIRKIESMAL